MNFSKKLNEYMNLLDCSIKELSEKSGLSYTLINRYVNNKRTPKANSIYFDKIIDAIHEISVQNGIDLTKETISKTFLDSVNSNNTNIDYDIFVENFITIQERLDISTSQMSKAVGYDTSFISRLRKRERKPSDFENFTDNLGSYIYSTYKENLLNDNLIHLLNCPVDALNSEENFKKVFNKWITESHKESQYNDVLNFLSKLDNFNLNDYVGTDFSKIKVPTTPVILRSSKTFFGIDGRKQAEGEFLKTTLLSKSEEPIFFYSDLPISSTGEDEEFKKRWVFAMTRLLKKGLHLNMVHNLDRPVNEMLLGLENWIPIYMTGSISPYYFKNPPSNFFQGSHCTSGSVALHSECINHNEKKCKFYLTTKKNEVDFEKEISKVMLSNATPLMKIYKETDKSEFDTFLNTEENKNTQRIKKDIFKNIDFCINEDKWIIINKNISPEIHFVIYNDKLIAAIKNFLLV